MRLKVDRAVAPQRGVKGSLRQRSEIGRRGVQGAPRPVLSFSRRNERRASWGGPTSVDWRFVAFAIGWTAFMATCAFIGMWRLS